MIVLVRCVSEKNATLPLILGIAESVESTILILIIFGTQYPDPATFDISSYTIVHHT